MKTDAPAGMSRSSGGPQRGDWRIIAGVVAITALAFLPSLFNGFTNFDDDVYLTENPLVAEPRVENLQRIFGGFYLRHYHPLTLLSFMIERAIWGLRAPGFHLTNLLLHLGSTWLVFAIARRLAFGRIAAATTSLLFGIHPIHVESVAWVTERKDVLAMFFLLLAMLLYFRHRESGRGRTYAGSLGVYALSLLAKALGITLAGQLWLMEWGRGDRMDGRKIVNKLPYLALGAGAALLTYLAQSPVIHRDKTALIAQNMAIAARGFWFYLGKLAWPTGLSALYPYPAQVDLLSPGYLAAMVGFVACAAFTLLTARRFRAWSAAWGFFVLALLPFSGIIVYGTHFAADRYMYLAALGPFALVGFGVERIATSRVCRERSPVRFVLAGAYAAAALALATATAARCRVWKNSETLFRDVLRQYPENTVALNNVATYRVEQGDFGEALRLFRRVIEIDESDFVAWANLGGALQAMGRLDDALAANLRAVKLRPDNALPWTNLGTLYLQMRDEDKAHHAFEQAARLDPENRNIREFLNHLP